MDSTNDSALYVQGIWKSASSYFHQIKQTEINHGKFDSYNPTMICEIVLE